MTVFNFFKRQLLILGFALVLVFFIGFGSDSFAEKSEKNDKGKTELVTEHNKNNSEYKNSSASNRGSGFRVNIDPDTGEFIHPAADGEIELNQAVTNEVEMTDYSETATEEPAAGGGVMLVRPGGFVHFSTATIDDDGRLSVNCTR